MALMEVVMVCVVAKIHSCVDPKATVRELGIVIRRLSLGSSFLADDASKSLYFTRCFSVSMLLITLHFTPQCKGFARGSKQQF